MGVRYELIWGRGEIMIFFLAGLGRGCLEVLTFGGSHIWCDWKFEGIQWHAMQWHGMNRFNYDITMLIYEER